MWRSVIDSLLPILLMIALGSLLRRYRFLPDPFFQGLNKLAFWIGLPCLLFLELSRVRVPGGVAIRISATIICLSLVVGLVAWLVASLLRLPMAARRVFVQGAFRGNLAYVGIPVVYYALQANPDARALAVLALGPTIPLFNVACVLLLIQPGGGGRLKRAWRALLEIGRNPLILASLLGLLAMRTEISLPDALVRTLDGVGRIGLPAALMALGASLSPGRVRGRAGVACASAAMKVALAPLIGYTIGRTLGLTGEMLLIAVLFAATPTAVASYVMADQMGADRELAAAIIVVSTLMAFPAMALVIMLAS